MGLPKIITIIGANASGKSSMGIELATAFNGEIISADSRQIYRGFDLCCGKVTAEEAQMVPHHLLDIIDIGDPFSVYEYQKMAYFLIPQILSENKIPFIVGGTGLYVQSVVEGYNFQESSIDISLRNKLELLSIDELQVMLNFKDKRDLNASDLQNKRRLIRRIEKNTLGESLETENVPIYDALQLGIRWSKEVLHQRIDERLNTRIEQGMINEVKIYLDDGGCQEHLYNLGLEYRHILWYLVGKYQSLDEFKLEMAREIKRFAKRQMTWFRGIEAIHWIDMSEKNYMEQANQLIAGYLGKQKG